MAAQIWEGKIKGAEANDACLRKDLRFVIIWADLLFNLKVMVKLYETLPKFCKFIFQVNRKIVLSDKKI